MSIIIFLPLHILNVCEKSFDEGKSQLRSLDKKKNAWTRNGIVIIQWKLCII